MGKNNDLQKTPTKARQRSARKLKTTMAISFEEVNGHHNVLVASRARHTQSLHSNDNYQAKTDSKALNLNVDFSDKADPFRARVEAVSDFLHKVSRSEEITLVISDPSFHLIVNASEPDASDAIEQWNELSEKFKNLSVVRSWDDDNPKTQGYKHLVKCSENLLQLHKNAILSK